MRILHQLADKSRGNTLRAPHRAFAARQLALNNVAGDDGDRITDSERGPRARHASVPPCAPFKAAQSGKSHITADGKPTFLPKHARERAKIARHRVSASRQMQNSSTGQANVHSYAIKGCVVIVGGLAQLVERSLSTCLNCERSRVRLMQSPEILSFFAFFFFFFFWLADGVNRGSFSPPAPP